MFAFERYNKRIKGLCRNPHYPLESLATSCRLDIATRYATFAAHRRVNESVSACLLRGKSHFYTYAFPTVLAMFRSQQLHAYVCRLSANEVRDLQKLGWRVSCVVACDIAIILGVHFKGNEWGNDRCGSVLVCTVAGKSRYCIVHQFLRIARQIFATVTWFSVPSYPYAPNPLVVCATIADESEQRRLGCVIHVKHVIPTSVYVEPHPDGTYFNLIRRAGVDII